MLATLEPASADASFRRYFRVQGSAGPCIVMDAPPPQEDVRPFVDVAQRIAQAGLNGPRVLASDPEQGFLLLSDLGQQLYLDALRAANAREADALMRDAIDALLQWQRHVPCAGLPAYDEALLARELALFPDWCVQREFGRTWSDAETQRWQGVCRVLIDSALAQPRGRGAPRLDAAQPDGRATQPRHPGLPGRGVRPDHLRHGLAAARRLHVMGRRA